MPGGPGWLASIVAAVLIVAPAQASALADFTWSGAASSQGWSNAGNWVGQTAPSQSVGTVSFPALTSKACTGGSPPGSCYANVNDIKGLSATGLSIDDGEPYLISGTGITLGSGGLTATTTNTGPGQLTSLNIPIALGAPQNWSVSGGGLSLGGAVTGNADAQLVVRFPSEGSNNAFLDLNGDTEVGAVSATGIGTLGLGTSLNGTDGNPVSLRGGAALHVNGSPSRVGPLTMTGGQISDLIGSTVSVKGGVTLDSGSSLGMLIGDVGTSQNNRPQISASGPVSLGDATLLLPGAGSRCPTFVAGDFYTLVTTTTGSLMGTFSGIPNGTVVPVDSTDCGSAGPTVRIDYTTNAVIATVVSTGSGTPTTTTLSASPSSPVTNQTVMLTATVTASSRTPAGILSFDNNGTAIAGCASQPVALNGASYTATCQATFSAASSPEALTAVFTPAPGSGLQPSTSSVNSLVIGKDGTATALAVSSGSPTIGTDVTYTATVTPVDTGAALPSGAVEFLDTGTAIDSCASQSLTAGSSSSKATCTLSYGSAGSHSITATYVGDVNFTASASPPQAVVTVQPAPPTVQAASVRSNSPTSLTFVGTVDPQGQPTTYHFEYGTTTRYGSSTPEQSAGSGTTPVTVSATVSGLKPGVVYQYRVVATNAAGTSRSAGTTAATAALVPVPGRTEVAVPVSGTVLIRLRGTRRFVRLTAGQLIPDGSELDVTNGRVRLIVAADRHGHTRTATLDGGRIIVHQTGGPHPRTIAALSLPLTGCTPVVPAANPFARIARRRPRRRTRHVWVTESGGSFNTSGQYVSTSVQGTTWLTADTCTTSLVRVTHGVVLVRDRLHHRTIRLRAGQSYTVRKGH